MTVDQSAPPQAAVLSPDTLGDFILGPGGFSSANLLPATIVQRRAVAIAKRRALLIVSSTLVLLSLMFVYLTVQQRSADAAKAEAQARVDAALAEKQKYAYVPAVYQAVTTARQDLATAMGQEVQVSRLMGGLSGLQPPGLSLSTVKAVVGPGSDQELTASETVIPGVGTVSFEGEAKTVDLVATWLDRVRLSADYESPVLDDVSRSAEDVYTFTATGQLTEQALSGRYVMEEG